MTCKDCLHYEACKGTYFTFEPIMDKDNFDNEHYADVYDCPDFTTRSEWVHLPCKVGDILYFVKNNTDACCPVCDVYNGYDNYCYLKQKCYPDLAEIPLCDKQFMEIVECKADLVMIVENMGKFGKTVFLTHDEAEKALEEMK